MAKSEKPTKKTDAEIWILINEKIKDVNYIFVDHAEQRKAERDVSDLTVINILENNGNARRKRNKSKDKYQPGYLDWNYCIEGYDQDNKKIRVIISFNSSDMLIITVIRI